jgi:hypothetical protein
MSRLPKKAGEADAKKRILNELEAKILNEYNSDQVTQRRKDTKSREDADVLFGCECDTKGCPEKISLSTQEYARMHRKNMHFVVIPKHVRLDIEEVVSGFMDYCVVKKLFPQPRTV